VTGNRWVFGGCLVFIVLVLGAVFVIGALAW
jgi:hypothetical protein